MSIFHNSIRDERARRYVPSSRVVAYENVVESEAVLCNFETQVSPWGNLNRESIIKPGGWILLDYGVELHGGIRLLSRNRGKVRVRFGESVSEAMQEPNQDHAIHDTVIEVPQNGMIEYGNTAFRFVRIDSVENENYLIFQNILAVSLLLELDWVGSFESSDERLNKIWQTGAYTVQLNMQDYIYDGAKRDRLPWMGDLNPEIRTILSVFSDTSLVKKTLDYIRESAPLPGWMNNIPSYSCWFVISHWEYYWHTGDLNYLAEQKDYIDLLLRNFAEFVGENGAEMLPERRFLDWPNNGNVSGLHAGLHGLLFWTFKCGERILNALGMDASLCQSVMKRMSKYVPDCGDCKAAAAMLTLSGIADRSDVLINDPFHDMSTFYGSYMICAQPTDVALEVIRKYWGGMLDYGATTFWEDFDLNWIKNATLITELPETG